MPEITGYAFPNDIHVHWSLMIVMYPYITGFVAGAFIVTMSALVFLVVFLLDMFGLHTNPYLGIVFFIIVVAKAS